MSQNKDIWTEREQERERCVQKCSSLPKIWLFISLYSVWFPFFHISFLFPFSFRASAKSSAGTGFISSTRNPSLAWLENAKPICSFWKQISAACIIHCREILQKTSSTKFLDKSEPRCSKTFVSWLLLLRKRRGGRTDPGSDQPSLQLRIWAHFWVDISPRQSWGYAPVWMLQPWPQVLYSLSPVWRCSIPARFTAVALWAHSTAFLGNGKNKGKPSPKRISNCALHPEQNPSIQTPSSCCRCGGTEGAVPQQQHCQHDEKQRFSEILEM